MNLKVAKELYDILCKLANHGFDIVFNNDNIPSDSNVNKQTLGNNMDQYIQCLLVRCLLDRKALNDEYFDIVKTITNYDSFINVPSLSSGVVNEAGIIKYVDQVLLNVPLFFSLVIHVDQVCKNDDPNFDTQLSRDVFACVVEIVKNIVPYDEIGDLAVSLYEAIGPVINKYKEAKLSYHNEEVL